MWQTNIIQKEKIWKRLIFSKEGGEKKWRLSIWRNSRKIFFCFSMRRKWKLNIVFAENLFVKKIVKNKKLPEKQSINHTYCHAIEFFISDYIIVGGTMSFGNIFSCEQDWTTLEILLSKHDDSHWASLERKHAFKFLIWKV